MMRRLKYVLGLTIAIIAPGAAIAEPSLQCRFTQICSGTEPCEAAPEEAVMDLKIDGDTAQVTMEGETEMFVRVPGGAEGMKSYLGRGPDDDTAMLLSVFQGGEILVSMHGLIFGPVAINVFGTCVEADG